MIARHITHIDVQFYRRHGWECRYLYMRGDDLHCFMAVFACCGNR